MLASVENTVGEETIGQLISTNDNGKKSSRTKRKQVDVSRRNTRGFERQRRIVPIEVRNE